MLRTTAPLLSFSPIVLITLLPSLMAAHVTVFVTVGITSCVVQSRSFTRHDTVAGSFQKPVGRYRQTGSHNHWIQDDAYDTTTTWIPLFSVSSRTASERNLTNHFFKQFRIFVNGKTPSSIPSSLTSSAQCWSSPTLTIAFSSFSFSPCSPTRSLSCAGSSASSCAHTAGSPALRPPNSVFATSERSGLSTPYSMLFAAALTKHIAAFSY
jgi:hypothetical protein